MTIESDNESLPQRKSSKKQVDDAAHLDPDFQFDVAGDPYIDFLESGTQHEDIVKKVSKPVSITASYGSQSLNRRIGSRLSR